MCEEAKALIIGYLDALEEYDRLHIMFLAARRTNDPEAVEGYRDLLQAAKLKLQTARGRLKDHQEIHNCCISIRLEDYPNDKI